MDDLNSRDPFADVTVAGVALPDGVHARAVKLLIDDHVLTAGQVAQAAHRSREWGSGVAQTLISMGAIDPRTYYGAVAQVQDLPFADFDRQPIDRSLIQPGDRRQYREMHLLPWRRVGGRVIVAATEVTRRARLWAASRYGADGYSFAITSPADHRAQSQQLFREAGSHEAREALFSWKPEHSAKVTVTRQQAIVFWVLLGLFVLGAVLAPMTSFVVLMAVFTTIYTLTFVFKFLLTFIGASRRAEMAVDTGPVEALSGAELPIYSVLVPMYREAKVLPLVTKSLQALNYPTSKLEVKLVLEEDDTETIDAALALNLPATFEIVRVPASQPKTKPKACNYALQFCHGEFVTIYDAEDQPEPDQLRKAVLAFRKSGKQLACVQARLNYFNRSENWLTRMFTLEYSQWFDFLLPGLDWLKVPIPLGGTSNHFRLSVLRKVGAWDPYNVTEDADLGIRLAQEGYTVGVINSTTFEEANGVLGSWIKQRSRWIKGYMQTWLVHMRHPIRLWATVGTRGFFAFHFFIGAPPLTMLLAPLLWLVFLASLLAGATNMNWALPEPFGTMAVFNLVVGNLFLVYFGVIAALKRRYFDLVPVGIMLPAYWVLHSIAAYKALWQLLYNPHYWEKTEHGTSAVTQASLVSVNGE